MQNERESGRDEITEMGWFRGTSLRVRITPSADHSECSSLRVLITPSAHHSECSKTKCARVSAPQLQSDALTFRGR